MKISKYLLSLGIILLFTTSSQGKMIDRFFESLGGQVNHTTPGSFQDQAAGYYTGGGYVMRQKNPVINPIQINLPRLGVGCNSLDLYFGAFSFLKSSELNRMFRAIPSAAGLYLLTLATKEMAPSIENSIAPLMKKVQDMSSLMLNSCQMAQQVVGGLWPKGTAASEKICMDQKLLEDSNNIDMFGARGHCEKPEAINKKVEEAKEKYKDLLMGEYNLVWHVLQNLSESDGNQNKAIYKSNKELAAFVMSITGTLISRKEGEQMRIRVIEPRADQKEFMSAYLKGGTTSVLACNEGEKCLDPKPTSITIEDQISEQQTTYMTMKAKVIQKIGNLRAKYTSKEALTADEISFLNDSVNVPVYRYIQVSVGAGTTFMMQDAAEYIGAMVLLTQFDRVMSEVLEAVDALQKIQLEDTAIAEFKQNLQAARGRVQALLIGANNGSIHLLNQSIQAIEQSIIARNS